MMIYLTASAEWKFWLPGISYTLSEVSEAVRMNYCTYLQGLFLRVFSHFLDPPSILKKLYVTLLPSTQFSLVKNGLPGAVWKYLV